MSEEMGLNINFIEAYVKLLEEGLDVWRPCKIIPIEDELGVVSSDGYDFDEIIETWECKPGEIVQLLDDGTTIKISPLMS